MSSEDVSDAAVTVVFSLFNSQGGALFMATLLAKKMGGKVKDFFCHENTNGVFVSADLGSGVPGPVLAHPVYTQQKSWGKP